MLFVLLSLSKIWRVVSLLEYCGFWIARLLSFKRPLLLVNVYVCLCVCLSVCNFDAKYVGK